MENSAERAEEQLTLRSQLGDMTRLSDWVASLAARHAIPEGTQFVVMLCLEESVSNIIRHGYADARDGAVVVRFAKPREGNFEFVVEDEAPRFNPLEAPEAPPFHGEQETRIGGQGIRLMRRLAGTLAYEPTSAGNRLKMSFSVSDSPQLD